MKYWWIIIVFAVLILSASFVFRIPKQSQVIINGKTYTVEVARSGIDRAQGLSNRASLDPSAGMLFVFDHPDIYSFWMKDTLIPLDIIWLAPSEVEGMSKIVEMTTLQPQNGNDIPKYTPQNKAQYVLELNANSGVKVGDTVKIKY